MDFDQITDNIYLGEHHDEGDWHIMHQLGVTVDINLMKEHQDRFSEPRPEVYLWLPVEDWTAPSIETLETGARFIALMLDQGRKVYIHCFAGIGRSPLIVAAYFITTGMSTDDALAFVREKRPVINPSQEQIKRLRAFAQRHQTS